MKEVYQLGPFHVDVPRQMLLRDGEPVPLTPKTFQILMVLIRHGQELVTKDDLMQEVWPDSFVEEANLSRNIFLLRKALGETPQDHRFIVTVPGRGYRLAENARLVTGEDVTVVSAHHAQVEVEISETRPWGRITAGVGLLVLAGALAMKLPLHRAAALTNKDTLVLADFANSTGEPVFDETLRQGMAVALEQSPFLSLINDQRIRQTLSLMRLPPDTRLTGELAREICERTGSAAVLEGSIARLGAEYVLGLRAKDCRTGDLLDSEQIQAARKEDVLGALGRVATQFRTRVGESLATIEKHSTPLALATTSSLDALKEFTTSIRANRAAGFASAIPHLERALAIDPQFAMAYGNLGMMYSNLGEAELAAQNTRKAYGLRDRVSDRERFWIEFLYDRQVTGNLKRGEETLEAWARSYPRDMQPLSFLAGRVTESSGDYEKGIAAASRCLELNPDDVFSYDGLAFHNLHLGRIAEAERAMQRAAAHKLENPDLRVIRYYIAFLKSDQAGMRREIEGARGSGVEDLLLHEQAMVAAYAGHMRQAERLWQQAVSLARGAGDRERAGMYEGAAAASAALSGNGAAAKAHAAAALELGKGRDVEYAAAFALARAGETVRAQALADDLAARFPEDTSVQFHYLPTLRAHFAVASDPAGAVAALEPAIPYEFAFPGTAFFGKFGALYPAYQRGEAYLAAGRTAEAAAEFQKIIDRPALTLADPVGPLARLQLARAETRAGDRKRAKAAYQEFLRLWTEADPEIPILQEARAEYGRLQ